METTALRMKGTHPTEYLSTERTELRRGSACHPCVQTMRVLRVRMNFGENPKCGKAKIIPVCASACVPFPTPQISR